MIEWGRSNSARANFASEERLQRSGDPLEQRAGKAPLPDKKFLFQRRGYREPARLASKIAADSPVSGRFAGRRRLVTRWSGFANSAL